jgi:hypothetical protein
VLKAISAVQAGREQVEFASGPSAQYGDWLVRHDDII